MEQRVPRHKSFYILPNLFTTASLFAGFLSIVWAAKGFALGDKALFEASATAILFSALMDGLDGKVARWTGTASEFGVQYDSLADLVAFGVAPAFMIFSLHLSTFGRVGVAAAFAFAACSALRLARFNVSTATANKRFFTGLPTPAAGCSLAALVLAAPDLPEFILPAMNIASLLLTLGIAFLMVSNIRYASFKELGVLKAHPFRALAAAVGLFALVMVNAKLFGALFLFGYILYGLVHTFFILPRLAKHANRTGGAHSEQ